jgi:hypothetical protein
MTVQFDGAEHLFQSLAELDVLSDAYEFPIDAAITQINTPSIYCK